VKEESVVLAGFLKYQESVGSFVTSLATFPWMTQQCEPSPEWHVFETRHDALYGLHKLAFQVEDVDERAAVFAKGFNETFDAAFSLAESLGCLTESRDAFFRVWSTTFDLVSRVVAASTEMDAGTVACNAARDTSLWAMVLIVKDRGLAPQYVNHALSRMDVWWRGFGLLCDGGKNNELFVYKRAGSERKDK